MRLDHLPSGCPAIVIAISAADDRLAAELREVGFAESDEVEVLYRGPLARRPICVRLNQTLVALREVEAAAIDVEVRP